MNSRYYSVDFPLSPYIPIYPYHPCWRVYLMVKTFGFRRLSLQPTGLVSPRGLLGVTSLPPGSTPWWQRNQQEINSMGFSGS